MVTVILFVIWSSLVIFAQAQDLKTDPPLIPLVKTNSFLVNRLASFQVYLPRNDIISKEITVDYGDQTSQKLLLQSINF